MANAEAAAGHHLSWPEREAEVRKHMQDEIRKTAERQAKRDAKARRDAERHIKEMHAAFPDRSKLIGALGMLGSDHAGERAAAALQVERIRAKLGKQWAEIIL
jgi:hypothetical protein